MLPDALATAVREVGDANGGVLLVDSAKARAILTDASRVLDVCRGLKRAGFTRFVDFTGMDTGGAAGSLPAYSPEGKSATSTSTSEEDEQSISGQAVRSPDSFTLYLSLRAPAHNHARLTLKWKWTQARAYAPCDNAPRGAGQPGDELQAGSVDSSRSERFQRVSDQGNILPDRKNGLEGLAPEIHPSLSAIWPGASVAEREIFEMLGIPFAGNALEPLLLDEAFVGHPLRRGFEFQPEESYIDKELRRRHEAGLLDALMVDTGGAADSLSAYAPEGESPNSASEAGDVEHSPSGLAVRYPEDSNAEVNP